MRGLRTISYFSEEAEVLHKRIPPRINVEREALTDTNKRAMRSFLKHIEAGNWERSIKYLRRLSKSNLFLTAVARAGFVVKHASHLNRREIINRVILAINERNRAPWLKGVTYHGYVNQVSNALFTEFRCDSVAAYFIIKDNKIRINRGWAQGWTPEKTARQMQR
ncbi:hypothetical protein [Arenicella xantha]|uniref:Uncharacterized protein n=1 Tax=Arenicella xantha TaxID=644221 RepID=A0A395JMI9_9GAMM|nr:hypothetical protein [Arenicella xantha]RBP52861.1 hypothetical protein DFR28_101245 [Arenicella xantha]